MKKKGNQPRILFATDLHYHINAADSEEENVNQYGYTGRERLSMFVENVLAEHKRAPLDACIILGDLSGNNYTVKPYVEEGRIDAYYGSEHDSLYAVKTQFLDRIEEAGVPVYCLPGNHDVYPCADWKRLFGYEREYLVELPQYDTAILMLDLYGFDLENPFFKAGRETVAPRARRTEGEEASLRKLLDTAKKYKHLIACGHWIDATAAPLLSEMKNLDCYLVGDAHSVANLGITKVGAPTYILGMFSYCIKEETKVKNGYGVPHVYRKDGGDVPLYAAPWSVDTKSGAYKDYRFVPATEEELQNAEIPKIALISAAEAAEHYRWNYTVLDAEQNGDGARMTVVYPKMTYHGISKTTGRLLRFHNAMFPSVTSDFFSPYEEKLLFALK